MICILASFWNLVFVFFATIVELLGIAIAALITGFDIILALVGAAPRRMLDRRDECRPSSIPSKLAGAWYWVFKVIIGILDAVEVIITTPFAKVAQGLKWIGAAPQRQLDRAAGRQVTDRPSIGTTRRGL
jgi:hypothetical protein